MLLQKMLILVLLSSKFLFAIFWLCTRSLDLSPCRKITGVSVVPGTSPLGPPSEQPRSSGCGAALPWRAPANIASRLLWSLPFQGRREVAQRDNSEGQAVQTEERWSLGNKAPTLASTSLLASPALGMSLLCAPAGPFLAGLSPCVQGSC